MCLHYLHIVLTCINLLMLILAYIVPAAVLSLSLSPVLQAAINNNINNFVEFVICIYYKSFKFIQNNLRINYIIMTTCK